MVSQNFPTFGTGYDATTVRKEVFFLKICLMPHPNTYERFSYLVSTLQDKADISICFPEEDPLGKQADLFVLEEESPEIVQRLLSKENPPFIAIAKEGLSYQNIRYLPDFAKDFPKLFRELREQTPLLIFRYQNESYSFLQQDILLLSKDKGVTVQFRQGKRLSYRLSFEKLAKRLSKQLFFSVGENCFVNAEYVDKIMNDAVILQNGQTIPFEAAMAEQVKNSFFKTKYMKIRPAT